MRARGQGGRLGTTSSRGYEYEKGRFVVLTKEEIRKPELQMARTLVENRAATWDPTRYTDQYRANLMKIIRARLKGKEPKLAEAVEPQQAEVVDLMERLRRSLEAARATSRTPARGKTAARGRRKRAA